MSTGCSCKLVESSVVGVRGGDDDDEGRGCDAAAVAVQGVAPDCCCGGATSAGTPVVSAASSPSQVIVDDDAAPSVLLQEEDAAVAAAHAVHDGGDTRESGELQAGMSALERLPPELLTLVVRTAAVNPFTRTFASLACVSRTVRASLLHAVDRSRVAVTYGGFAPLQQAAAAGSRAGLQLLLRHRSFGGPGLLPPGSVDADADEDEGADDGDSRPPFGASAAAAVTSGTEPDGVGTPDAGTDTDTDAVRQEALNTALARACEFGHDEVVAWLLDAGADPADEDFFALVAAVQANRLVVVDRLLDCFEGRARAWKRRPKRAKRRQRRMRRETAAGAGGDDVPVAAAASEQEDDDPLEGDNSEAELLPNFPERLVLRSLSATAVRSNHFEMATRLDDRHAHWEAENLGPPIQYRRRW